MATIKFRTADEFIESKKPIFQPMLLLARQTILETSANIYEKMAYNTPFFYQNSWLCYLAANQKDCWIGFTEGIHLNLPFLEAGDRKQIRILRLDPQLPFPSEFLQCAVWAAIEYDSEKTSH